MNFQHVSRSFVVVSSFVVATGCASQAPTGVIEGHALGADGKPLASATLSVKQLRLPDGGAIPENGSWSGHPTLVEESSVHADATGKFVLNVDGNRGGIPNAWSLEVPSTDTVIGPTFYVSANAMALTDVRSWQPNVRFLDDAQGATTVLFDKVPSVVLQPKPAHPSVTPYPGQGPLYYGFQLWSKGTLIWSRQSTDPGADYPVEALEDFADVQIGVEAVQSALTAEDKNWLGVGTGNQSFYTVVHEHVLPAKKSGTVTPLSRGVPCQGLVSAPAVCPLTDGKIDAASEGDVLQLDARDPNIVFTLSAPTVLRKAIVRGVELPEERVVTLEGSADGTTWKTLGNLSKAKDALGLHPASMIITLNYNQTKAQVAKTLGFWEIPLNHDVGPISHVRLHVQGYEDGDNFLMSELSLFQ